ncbi:hypothetical protein [Paenarthrobacter sp. NPDC089316]
MVDGELPGIFLAALLGPIFVMAVAVAVGLPLRLNRRLSRWWLGNLKAYILTVAGGAALIISGYIKLQRQSGANDGDQYAALTPDVGLIIGGCFVLTFLAVNAGFTQRTTREAAQATEATQMR